MRNALIAPLFVASLLAMACGPAPNPHKVWIAPDGSELAVKLVPSEPPPF